jgi:DNA-binding Lrp family transcriptional regulator
MPSAFVLVNCKRGSEERIVHELRLLHEVVEANRVLGVYNVVAKVKADTSEQLRETINWKIRTTQGIKSTLTFFEIPERGSSNSNSSRFSFANEEIPPKEEGKQEPSIDMRKKSTAGAS